MNQSKQHDDSRQFIVQGEGLPRWENPISHAVVAGNMCFVSGQLSVSEAGNYVSDSAKGEAMRAFKNVFNALRAAGFSPSDITFVDIAFSDLEDLPAVNRVFVDLFPENKRPARTVYQAAKLPFGGKIKVVATAVKC